MELQSLRVMLLHITVSIFYVDYVHVRSFSSSIYLFVTCCSFQSSLYSQFSPSFPLSSHRSTSCLHLYTCLSVTLIPPCSLLSHPSTNLPSSSISLLLPLSPLTLPIYLSPLTTLFICSSVANSQLRGNTDIDRALILQYVNFADGEILPAVCTWTFPTLGIMQPNQQVYHLSLLHVVTVSLCFCIHLFIICHHKTSAHAGKVYV